MAWLSIAALHAVPKQWLKTTTISLYLTILWVRNSSRTPLSDSSISRGVLMEDIVLQEGDGDSWACLGPDLSSVVPSQWPTTPSVSREQDKLHSLNDLVLKVPASLALLYWTKQSEPLSRFEAVGSYGPQLNMYFKRLARNLGKVCIRNLGVFFLWFSPFCEFLSLSGYCSASDHFPLASFQ